MIESILKKGGEIQLNFATLNDLFVFCKKNKLFHYNAAESDGKPLIVQIK